MRKQTVIGSQVRRLRSQRNWSQNDFAIKLQLLGMENATRCKVSKIEARLVCMSDDDLIFLARGLGVSVEDLYPDFILAAKRLYEAICIHRLVLPVGRKIRAPDDPRRWSRFHEPTLRRAGSYPELGGLGCDFPYNSLFCLPTRGHTTPARLRIRNFRTRNHSPPHSGSVSTTIPS